MSNQENNWLREALDKQRIGDIDGAIQLHQRILRGDPKHYLATTILGILYLEQKNADEAQRYIQKAAAMNPDTALLQIAFGALYKLRGEREAAVDAYQRAIQLSPQLAEPYYQVAEILAQKNQNLEVAEEYLRQAITLNPQYADAYYCLGNVLVEREKGTEAIEYFQAAISHDPKYDIESTHFMMAVITGKMIDNPPRDYVENVFDNYADHFEADLVENLGYTAPARLRAFFPAGVRFNSVLDLGCGTGLCGVAFRDMAERLAGIDVSARMIEKSQEKKCYDALFADDLNTFLEQTTEQFDLFIAADVFIYVGSLERLFKNIRKAALSGAHLVFSTEKHEGSGFQLLPSARYAHAASYIEKLAKESGFTIRARTPTPLRKQHGEWLEGELYHLVSIESS